MPRIGHSKVFLPCVVLAMLFGCAEQDTGDASSSNVVRVAVTPNQAEDRLRVQYAPLLNYLASESGLEFELSIPRDYADLLHRFGAGEVDLAWFGGLTFIQAAERSGAVPVAFRDIDMQFTSCYLVAADDPRNEIADFRGESFAFGPTLSTSGHLMPRFYLQRDGLQPEKWFSSVRHSTAHDQTALSVSDGTVALGVANCAIIAALFDNGTLDSSRVRILETTPPYSDYVWAVSPAMSAHRRVALLNAFLALDADVAEHREILRLQGANMYMPAGLADFEIVRIAAMEAGVLADEKGR